MCGKNDVMVQMNTSETPTLYSARSGLHVNSDQLNPQFVPQRKINIELILQFTRTLPIIRNLVSQQHWPHGQGSTLKPWL